ncbi:MAG: chemotaxis protein CheW, partial [Bryobacteraceae bacterium]
MGDGRVALILDVLGIGQLAGVITEAREQAISEVEQAEGTDEQRQTFLLFRAGSFERLGVPLALVARLEEFPQARVERAGGRPVVQYRGHILPLVPMAQVLEPGAEDTASRQDPVQAIVFSDGERSVGVLVDQILDIIEEAVQVRQQSGRAGLLGSAVIGGKVTDIVDLRAVLEQAGQGWFAAQAARSRGPCTVLLADGSAFWRGLARCRLEMAGHRVLEAASAQEALARLKQHRVEVVAVALDLPGGAGELVAGMKRDPALAGIPVLALAGLAETPPAGLDSFAACQAKFDHEAVLASIERLAAAVGVPAGDPAGVRVG